MIALPMTTQASAQKHAQRETQDTQEVPEEVASFEQMYQQHQQALVSYLTRSTGNRELAEDLTQETFVKAWQVRKTKLAPKHVKAWLYRVAQYRSIDVYRRAIRYGRITTRPLQEVNEDLKDDTTESNLAECYGTQELVRITLARMKQEARQILLLALQEGYSYQEMSELLGLTLPAVRMRIYRARQSFRRLYRELDQSDLV